MRLVTSLTVAAALVAAAPAANAADGPCDTEAANHSSLCNAFRPTPWISATPMAPRIGGAVVLESSTTSRGSTLAWDLDGDGQFDDATGTKVTTTLAGSAPRVAVSETDQFGRTGSASLTLAAHAFNALPSGTVTFSTRAARTGHALTVKAEGEDPDGKIASVDLDLDGDGVYETPGAEHDLTFATTGIKTIGARFTDDAGGIGTATATIGVHAANLPPHLEIQLAQANGSYTIGAPLIAGDAKVTAYGRDSDGTIAGFEFDLDGNGSFETRADPGAEVPNGIMGVASTTFTAGEHEIGVRVSDADGGTTVVRQSVLAVPEWPVTGAHAPPVVPMFAGLVARPGVPARLFAGLLEPGATLAWDADGDGDFDDGSGSPLQFTYPAAGEYTARVKATSAGGERIAWATVWVRDAPALPPVLTADLPAVVRTGRSVGFEALVSAADGVTGGIDLTFDLDGDGQFDDIPSGGQGFYSWTPAGAAKVAVKATDSAAQTAIRSVDLAPPAGNLGPGARWNPMPAGFPGPDAFGEPVFLAGRATVLDGYAGDPDDPTGCCTYTWDPDGDGIYGAPTGTVAQQVFSAGEHTAGLRVIDADGDASVMTRTFTVGSYPPKASFTVSGSTVTSTSTDQDGEALTTAWDLDGDRDFDDASGPTARALEGAHLVGLKVTDPTGEIGITYANVTGGPLPQPTRAAPGPIAQPPLQLTVAPFRTPKLATALKSGLSLTVRCSASCRVTVVASVDKKTAKKLHLRSRNVGRGIGFGAAVKVKLTADAKRALKRVKSVKLLLTMTAVGSDGLGAATSQTVTLKR